MFAKKNLVAAAALLALAGAAQADVKAYGLIDLSFGSFESFHAKGTDARVTAVESGALTTSFIGFGGSEDLGGGLKAEFALESFLAADTGATVGNIGGNFWGRASWLALSGGFGRVIVGQYDNAFFTQGWSYSAFGSSMPISPTMNFYYSDAFSTSALSGNLPPWGVAGLAFDTGWSNSITYESPNLSGFTFSAQYAPKETSTGGKDNYTLSGAYNAGPLSVMLNYARVGADNAFYLADQKAFGLGASYDFGVVKVLGQYGQAKTDIGAPEDWKLTTYELGAVVPVSEAGAVLVAYGEGKYSFMGDSFKHRVLSLGYDHKLSKRTDVYAAFKNDAATSFEAGQTFAVGIRHNF